VRHGAASLSLAAGNDLKIVQAPLGHSSIVLTADTYTSVLPCLAHQAAEATAELIRHAGRDRGHRIRGHPLQAPQDRPRSAGRQTHTNGHNRSVSRWPHAGLTDQQRPPTRST
jgi:integrase